MLQKLDTEHLKRLAMAEALANMSIDDFDMRDTRRCIFGHTLRMFAERPFYFFGAWESQLRAGAGLVGLSIEQARDLFVPANRAKVGCDNYTHPQDAARVVRYLAATDTVDWGVAGKL
jgi:lysozyme family protein